MRRRARGTTLVEVMISMSLVLAGMLALFRVLGASVAGSATASRFVQAELRASSLVETMRIAPPATLSCLAAHDSADWRACGNAYAIALPSDRSGQRYLLDRKSCVTVGGKSGRLYDVNIVVGFSDDRYRTVALHTAVLP